MVTKELSKLSNSKNTQQKMDKIFEQMFWQRRCTNVKQMKRCSILFITGEIQSQLQ